MLEEIESLGKTKGRQQTSQALIQAEDCFLNTLAGWGPTNFLKEHIKLCKYEYDSLEGADDRKRIIKDSEGKFARRFQQTSAGYLRFPVLDSAENRSLPPIRSEGYYDTKQSLFDIDEMIKTIAPLTTVVTGEELATGDKLVGRLNSRVALDAMAKLNMMKGKYDVALKCFLTIGALHTERPLTELENRAIELVRPSPPSDLDNPWKVENGIHYTFVLDMIDGHHLQQCLLDRRLLWILGKETALPLFALLQLCGLEAAGNFLMEHCVAPQSVDSSSTSSSKGERRGTLPLDLVAKQLDGRPKLLYWYLHLVFTRRPEVYVKFPNTAFPPKVVTDLHRKHFQLYLKFAGADRDSSTALSGVEQYKVANVTTPLLTFLKVKILVVTRIF